MKTNSLELDEKLFNDNKNTGKRGEIDEIYAIMFVIYS